MTRRLLWSLTFTPAGVILLGMLAVGTWQSTRLAQEHKALAAELSSLRGFSDRAAAPRKDDSANAEIASTSEAIAQESARLKAVESKIQSAEKGLPPMTGEELRSLGRIEEFARKAASFIEQVGELARLFKDKSNKTQSDEAIARATQQIGNWAGWLEVIAQMEDDPQEIARLHAQTIAQRLNLERATTTRLQEQIAAEFEQLAASGLIRSQRPPLGDAAKEWNQRRSEALHAAAARVEEFIPSSQRQPWIVEQSLQLGNALRQEVTMSADGHGSAVVAVVLPGLQM